MRGTATPQGTRRIPRPAVRPTRSGALVRAPFGTGSTSDEDVATAAGTHDLSPAKSTNAPVLPWRIFFGLIAVAFGAYLAGTNAASAQVLGRAVGAAVQWYAGAPEP